MTDVLLPDEILSDALGSEHVEVNQEGQPEQESTDEAMGLWKISADVTGWDTFDSAVVAAKTAQEARAIHPDGYGNLLEGNEDCGSWVSDPRMVECEFLGKAKPGTKPGVICASYNAG